MPFDLRQGIEVLQRTPKALRALLAGLPNGWLTATEGPETWSPIAVLGHLIHGEETDWIPRARLIIAHGESRSFEPFDRFAMFQKYRGWSLEALLARFAELRARNLGELEGWRLTPEQLLLRGRHPELGPVTLEQLLATWVAHDLGHIAQIARVMAKQYDAAVGPWKAYLPILSRPHS